jgi:hypothetical protein
MCLSLVAFFIAALLQIPAQTTGFRISGRVLDGETGKPIVDAVVTLSDGAENGVKRTATIGTNGLFEFANVPRGSYTLQTRHPNPVVPYRSESLEINLTKNLDNVGLVLSPAVSRVPITGRVVVAGGEPLPAAISSILFSNEAVTIQRDGSFQTRLRATQRYEIALQKPPEGFYVDSVSGGTWNRSSNTWFFRDTPNAPVEVVLGFSRLRISGRVVDSIGNPLPQAVVTLSGPLLDGNGRVILSSADSVSVGATPPPSSMNFINPVVLNSAAAFSIGAVRPGNYELRARTGTGDNLTAGFLPIVVTANQANLEIVVKPSSPVAGQIVVLPPRTVSELVRFNVAVEINDALGSRTVRVDSRGAFQFRSFEPDYSVTVRNLPVGLRYESHRKSPGSVEIRLETVQGDPFPGLRFNDRLR